MITSIRLQHQFSHFLSLIALADVSRDTAFEYALDGPQGRTGRRGEEQDTNCM